MNLHEAIESYLCLKRSLGAVFSAEGRILHSFGRDRADSDGQTEHLGAVAEAQRRKPGLTGRQRVEPLEIEGVPLRVSASVGVSICHAGESMSVDDLLRRSDVAMYHAKARGKHRAASYAPELEEQSPAGNANPAVRRAASAA